MNQPQVNETSLIEKLKERAKNDPVFYAMCNKFAQRERTRAQVTVAALKQSMDRAGYTFTKADYAEALKFLSSLHIGALNKNSRGRITALKDIKWTLQSIGTTSLESDGALNKMSKRVSKRNVPALSIPTPASKIKKPLTPEVVLTISLGGQKLNLPVFKKLTEEELGNLITDLYGGMYHNGKVSEV